MSRGTNHARLRANLEMTRVVRPDRSARLNRIEDDSAQDWYDHCEYHGRKHIRRAPREIRIEVGKMWAAEAARKAA